MIFDLSWKHTAARSPSLPKSWDKRNSTDLLFASLHLKLKDGQDKTGHFDLWFFLQKVRPFVWQSSYFSMRNFWDNYCVGSGQVCPLCYQISTNLWFITNLWQYLQIFSLVLKSAQLVQVHLTMGIFCSLVPGYFCSE